MAGCAPRRARLLVQGGFGLRRFQRTVGGSIETAEWARPHLNLPACDWVAIRKLRDMIYVRAYPHGFSTRGVIRLPQSAGFRVTHADLPSRIAAVVGHSHRMNILAQ